jgi:hypothetical protein
MVANLLRSGQSTLPSSCPVCEHTPVSAEDCKPNKSLRTTIKVFLRTEEKKREALRLKEAKNSPPIASVDSVPTPIEVPTPAPTAEQDADVQVDVKTAPSPAGDQTEGASAIPDESTEPLQAEEDIPQPSIEVCTRAFHPCNIY